MLKLYIYGYLNRVPSSRRLERSASAISVDLADRAVGAGLQDHRGFPQGQWQGHSRGLSRAVEFGRPLSSISPYFFTVSAACGLRMGLV
jgi:hypothetical protein